MHNTALHEAARQANATMIQLLVNAGANLEMKNSQDKRPYDLIPAASAYRTQNLKRQLMPLSSRPALTRVKQVKAEHMAKSKRNTPMHLAASSNNVA